MFCLTQELIGVYAISAEEVLKSEMETFAQISPEEWDLLKPKPNQRAADIMQRMKGYLAKEGWRMFRSNFSKYLPFPP